MRCRTHPYTERALPRGSHNPAGKPVSGAADGRVRHRSHSSRGPVLTRKYVARRTAEGLGKKEIIRCLKRYVAREVYRELIAATGLGCIPALPSA
jgi:hypothetical protein